MNHFNKSGAFSSAKSVRQSVAIEGNLVYSAAVLHQQDLHRLVCAAHHVGPFCEVKPDYTPRTLTRIPVRVVIPVLAIICLICSLTVCSVIVSALAISLFVQPFMRLLRTAISRSVKPNRVLACATKSSCRGPMSSRIISTLDLPPTGVGKPKPQRKMGCWGSPTTRFTRKSSQSLTSVRTARCLTTSSQTCVTGGGRTPAAVFPDELCIRLQMSQARRSL